MVGLEENSEGSDAAAFLMKSLPQWFPSLADKEMEVMRDHRIYNSGLKTLIFNLLQYSDRQSILQVARKNPLTLSGWNMMEEDLSPAPQTRVVPDQPAGPSCLDLC
ncbi:hypothetical protein EOD39_4345 [Acipenser ruthenus]|uniref:Uncharacterized protein n=1 Tax=Acipenser ruthenus TaxID=7906 RepID=A0A444UIT8_ACIRT|nr:hypothetical protein EOD39_4345 [Acipenser ruthenus]